MEFLVTQFSPASCYFLSLGSKYSLQLPVSKAHDAQEQHETVSWDSPGSL
jgi:hypothetical protein